MEDDDAAEIKLDVVDSSTDRGPFDPDEEYAMEWGYSLLKTLRGSSVGRQMKRCLFWLGCYHMLYGLPMFILAIYADNYFSFMREWGHYKSGSSLLGLVYGTSFLALFFGTLNLASVRYWSSLVTNRDLLVNLMGVYQVILVLMWIMVIVTIAKLFDMFDGIDWTSFAGQALLPSYIISIICLFPYLIAVTYYGLDVSFLSESIYYGGNIAEPEPLPDHTLDLNGLTIMHIVMAIVAVPLLAFDTCREWAVNMWEYVERKAKKKYVEHREKSRKKAKARRSFWNRITKTISRFYNDLVKDRQARKAAFEDRTPLAGLTDQTAQLREDAQAARLAALIAERDAKEAEARAEKERKEREEAMAPTMSARKFKELWTALGSAGSFQCKLKTVSQKHPFVEHIRKQGFHVVFVADPDAGGFEVGICNVREEGKGGPWFMARFMTREKTFSAVMKCQDPSVVTGHVKRFALAKVLRIDTSG